MVDITCHLLVASRFTVSKDDNFAYK